MDEETETDIAQSLIDLKNQMKKQDVEIHKLRQYVLQSTKAKASRKAYENEVTKHYWMSTLVSFLFGVSVGVLTMNICTFTTTNK